MITLRNFISDTVKKYWNLIKIEPQFMHMTWVINTPINIVVYLQKDLNLARGSGHWKGYSLCTTRK